MNKKLQNKLKAYSALTAVAVVGANEAEAQINATTVNYTGGYETYDIDIDGDGTDDYRFSAYNYWGGTYGIGLYGGPLNIYGLGGNQVMMQSGYVAALDSNASVGLLYGQSWTGNAQLNRFYYFNSYTPVYGNWGASYNPWDAWTAEEHYMGIQFDINGEMHNGWIRFTAGAPAGNEAQWTIHEVAYEEQAMVTAYTNNTYNTSYVATTVTDVSNNLNASDAKIRITPDAAHIYADSVTHAYGLIVKDDGRDFTIADAMGSGVDPVEIEIDGSSTSYEAKMNAWTYDQDGELILQGFPYLLYVGIVDENNGAIMRLEAPVSFRLDPTVGVDELSASDVSIYTANGELIIESNEALNNATVAVYDIMGKLVVSDTMNSTRFTKKMNVSDGIYVVNITTPAGILTQKVKM